MLWEEVVGDVVPLKMREDHNPWSDASFTGILALNGDRENCSQNQPICLAFCFMVLSFLVTKIRQFDIGSTLCIFFFTFVYELFFPIL